MEKYTYNRLDPGHIRLISLSVTDEDELAAVIKEVYFDDDDPVAYSALSYVWGTSEFSIPITCNGDVLHITPTLDQALRQVIKSNTDEWIWVDQICINQQDNHDKSVQVNMMNSIFNRARTVIAFVGTPTMSTPLAVDLVNRVGVIAARLPADEFREESDAEYHTQPLQAYEKISVEQSERLGVSFNDAEAWDALSEFYDRPWFERIWIVQEILPARNAIAICGPHIMPWEHVKNAALWYHFKAGAVNKRHKRSIDGIALTCGMNLSWNVRMGAGSEPIRELLGQKTYATHKWALERLLATFRQRKATDPKDKVYALLGLSDLCPGLRPKHIQFEADYSKDIKTIFTETARAIIKMENKLTGSNLDVILQARRSTCTCEGPWDPNWPSWVPDWRRHVGHGCEWGIGQPFNEWESEMNSGTHRDEEPPEDIFALRTRGVILGRTLYVSPHRHLSQIAQHGHLREAHEKCLSMLSSYPTGEDVAAAFAMMILGGRFPKAMAKLGTTVEMMAENYLGFLDVVSMPRNTVEDEEAREQKAQPYIQMGFNNDWLKGILDAYCERRWYILDTGYIGLGNHHMQQGDVVAKLVGLSAPCVLKARGEKTDEYEYIGEAYCHGEMNGGQDKAVTKEVVLR